MIRYALKCNEGHGFDSWFESAEAFDTLSKRGLVSCPQCGATGIEKAIMAPGLSTGSNTAQGVEANGPVHPTPLSAPSEMETAIARMRAHVEANSEYVGRDFARAARDMHEGLEPERSIHGEANTDEAKKLIEDGVPVAPLPFTPNRKVN